MQKSSYCLIPYCIIQMQAQLIYGDRGQLSLVMKRVHEQSLCVLVMSVYLEAGYVGVFSMYKFI